MQDSHKCSCLAVLFALLIWGDGSPSQAEVFLPQLPDSEQQPVHSLEVAGDALWVLGNRDLYRVGKDGEPRVVKTAARATAVVSFEERVYFGTKAGLYRFGNEDTPERSKPSVVTAMAVFEEDLWIGADTGLYVLGHWDPIHPLNVTDLKVINGDLWISSYQGAYRISGSVDSSSPPASSRAPSPILFENGPPPPVRGVEWIHDEIWLITLNRDTRFDWASQPYLVRDDKAIELESTDDWQASSAWATTGGVVFATKDGFGTLDENRAGILTPLEEPVLLIFEFDNFAWIGTTKGLYRAQTLDGQPEKSPAGGLLKVHDFEVFDGSLWIAAEQGLFKLESHLQLSGRVRGLPLRLSPAKLVVEYSGRSERDYDRLPSSITVSAVNSASSETGKNLSEANYDASSGLVRLSTSLDFGFDSTSLTLSDELGNSSQTLEYKVLNLPRLWTWSFIVVFFLITLALLLSLRNKLEVAESDE